MHMHKFLIYINYFTYILSCIVPKKKNRWVFGAWFGNRISDNSYALYKYVREAFPDIEAVWICNDINMAKKEGIDAVKRNTLQAVWKCLTAKVSVMNQGYLDFGNLNWIFKSYKVQLWHGVPWKKIGEDTTDEKTGFLHLISHKTYLFANKYDLYIAPSDKTREVLKTAFIIKDDKIISVGQPRNEILMDEKCCAEARSQLEEEIGNYEKIIVYMPTFRDKSGNPFSFMSLGYEIESILEAGNAVILEKQHFVDLQKMNKEGLCSTHIRNAAEIESQKLLAAAYILITDYSSCFFDYVLKDKPIIHYLYDYEQYKNADRGLYYSIEEATAGTVVYNTDELLSALSLVLQGEDTDKDKRHKIRDTFDTYESIYNSRTICEKILKQ